MRTSEDAKLTAKALRRALTERGIDLTHSDCLEIVAKQAGYADWNTLNSRLDADGVVLRLPEGWQIGGSNQYKYDVGILPDDSNQTPLIRNKVESGVADGDFATLMQSIGAGNYLGKTLRLAAELRTRNVTGAGTLWMRVDGHARRSLRFDNMETREKDGSLSGTTEWTPRDIVLAVPAEAESIHFGFFLRGRGCVWCRNVTLDVAEAGAQETGDGPLPDTPRNLGFGATA